MLPEPAGSAASQGKSSPLFYRWRNRNPGVDWVPAQGPTRPGKVAKSNHQKAKGHSSVPHSAGNWNEFPQEKRSPFGSCGHPGAAKYQAQDSGFWHP